MNYASGNSFSIYSCIRAPERIFLFLAIILGTVYLFITPPCASPDENNHFYKGWSVQEGHLFAVSTTDSRLGDHLPLSLKAYAELYAELRFCDTCTISGVQWKKDMQRPLIPQQVGFMDFANTGFYAPIAYLPQALVYKICTWLRVGPGFAFYIGRLIMFFCWLFLCWKALSLTPVFKELLALFMLLPASLAFHISLNPDLIVHGLGFLLLSLILKDRFSTNQDLRTSGWQLALVLATITLMKPHFIALGLLFFIKPKAFPLGYRNWLRLRMMLLIPAIFAFFFIRQESQDLFIPYSDYHPEYRDSQTLQPGANPVAQMQVMLDHPLHTANVFVISWWHSAPATLAHYVGKFGWYHHYLPGWMLALLLVGLLFATLTEEPFLDRPVRWIFILTGVVLAILFSVAMYLLWTPVGHPELLNLQGRYFVLIFPLFFIAIHGYLPINRKYVMPVLWLLWVLANCWMIGQMYSTFWS